LPARVEALRRAERWEEKVRCLVRWAVAEGHGLIFLDNISRIAVIEAEGGVERARGVEKLQDACREAGLTLLIDAYHKKGKDGVENKLRGGSGLPGAVEERWR